MERIVVGVDGSEGSEGSIAALRWAVEEGALRGAVVEVAEEMACTSDVFESAELHRLALRVDPPVRDWDVLHGHDVCRALVDDVRRFVGASGP